MVARTLIGVIGRTVISLTAAAAIAIAGWTFARSWRPSSTSYKFQGLEVGEQQGPVDWWTVRAAGADFAYIRATSGASKRDGRFAANWADARSTGMRRGALHVYSLCNLATDQANNFNTTVPRDQDALPAAVEIDFQDDCASRPGQPVLLDELRRFLTMVEEHTGKPVLLKITKRFDAAYKVTAAIPRPVWAVQDFFPPDYAATPWRMWQASGMRRIDGVSGAVNWDVVAP
ncbi:MAG: GH25 family lysozyme [Sphingomonas sp.]